MRFRIWRELSLHRELTGLAVAAVSMCAAAWAAPSPQGASAASTHEFAVWVPSQLDFQYRELTTQYSCSGLQQRVKSILLELGARPDVEVRNYGCTKLTGPDPFAGVRIRMSVLEPAGSRPGLAAHWQTVDLLANRELLQAAGDCELIEQIAQKILPLFTVRNVDYTARCQPRSLQPGSTRLKADVLVADRSPPPATTTTVQSQPPGSGAR